MTNPSEPVYPKSTDLLKTPDGLTKREYFAAMVLQGMLAAGDGEFSSNHIARIMDNVVNHTDALIERLNKPAQ